MRDKRRYGRCFVPHLQCSQWGQIKDTQGFASLHPGL